MTRAVSTSATDVDRRIREELTKNKSLRVHELAFELRVPADTLVQQIQSLIAKNDVRGVFDGAGVFREIAEKKCEEITALLKANGRIAKRQLLAKAEGIIKSD
jgi:predicted TIM-barrel fold metal-dependent hydrolase